MNGLDVENVCEVIDVLTNILIDIEDMVGKADHKHLDLADAGGHKALIVLLGTRAHLPDHRDVPRADESSSVQVIADLHRHLGTKPTSVAPIPKLALHHRIIDTAPGQ